MVEPDRSHDRIMRLTHIACWITRSHTQNI